MPVYIIFPPQPPANTWTTANIVTSRAVNTSTATTTTNANQLGTIVQDLQALKIFS